MPSYDDDDMGYGSDDVPQFQDEAEFDDYLNDEEYQLMSEMFPRAKQELEEYQGWDNLAVKLAIFDHEFDVDSALVQLKRDYKKKRANKSSLQEDSKSSTTTKARKEPEKRPLLKLEQLAKQRLEQKRKKAANLAPNVEKEPRGKPNSLLSRLQSIRVAKNEKSSPLKSVQRESQLSSKLSGKTSSISTLGSKLLELKKSIQPPQSKSKPTQSDKLSDSVRDDTWQSISDLQLPQFPFSQSNQSLDLEFTSILKNIAQRDPEQYEIQKQKHYDAFSVFFPRKRLNTNNDDDYIVKKQAIANFQKPSPDDIIETKQAKAFQKVTKDVSGLQISDASKQSSEGSMVTNIEENEEDGFDSKEDSAKIITYKKATVPTKPKKPVNMEEFLKTKKPHCSFVVLGHVDAGKSTLMGRVLVDVGAIDISYLRKLKRESERIGKGSFHLAWVMDQTSEERERGVTVSICTSDFATEKADFTIVDAPGHRDFVPNAISGISQAEVAILSVDCGIDAFEHGFNLDGQTKEHALLARSMGVTHMLVAMNKMDTVDWYEGRFVDIKNELSTFFEDMGFKDDQISWIPCSGITGEGVYKIPYPASQNWYKGPSLIEKLELIASEISVANWEDISKEPFLFSTLEVVPSSKDGEATITGRVESGSIQPGETITIYPSEQSVMVDKVILGNDKLSMPVAVRNDFATLKIRHAHPEDIQGGDLAASVGYDISARQEFSLHMLTFTLDRPLLPGTPVMLFRGVCEQPARIKKLIGLTEKNDSSKILKRKVRHIGSNQAAIVDIELVEKKRWIPMLSYKQNKHLGRVILRKDGRTIAAGLVLE